jgi:hypothetical protein
MTTPVWLDPATEIKNNDQPEGYKKLDDITKSIVFILTSYKALRKCSSYLTTEQIFWVIGNSIAETGWGRSWRGFNFGGWKINKDYADSYKKSKKRSAPWWQAAGHVASGDEPVVYYRGYIDPSHFYSEWLERFVPSVPNLTVKRYNKTGQVFWEDRPEWFRELCLAGYKGPVTQANPDKSVNDWENVVHTAQVRVAQYLLKVKVDGSWGAKSQAACDAFALNHQLPTGQLTLNVLTALLSEWEMAGSQLPFIL